MSQSITFPIYVYFAFSLTYLTNYRNITVMSFCKKRENVKKTLEQNANKLIYRNYYGEKYKFSTNLNSIMFEIS